MTSTDIQMQRNRIPTLTDWAIQEVRAKIVLGEFEPGERLPIEQLAEELGISRVPLREAIRSLESEGMITTTPHRGAIATPMSIQDAEDAYTLLELAELRAVERAARATDHSSTRIMHASLETMRAHVDEPHVTREALEAHRAFHFAFFDRAGEGLLLRQLRILWYTCERYVMSSIPSNSRAAQALKEHEELARLVEEGDVDGAREHLRHHLQSSFAAVREYLEADA